MWSLSLWETHGRTGAVVSGWRNPQRGRSIQEETVSAFQNKSSNRHPLGKKNVKILGLFWNYNSFRILDALICLICNWSQWQRASVLKWEIVLNIVWYSCDQTQFYSVYNQSEAVKSWRILTRLAFRIKSLWLRWLFNNPSIRFMQHEHLLFWSLETGSLLPRQQRFKAVNRLCLRWWWAHTHRCRQQHRREQRGVKDAAARDPFVS